MTPTNQQIEACATDIHKASARAVANDCHGNGYSLTIGQAIEILTRHLTAPMDESIAQTVSRINDTPATVESDNQYQCVCTRCLEDFIGTSKWDMLCQSCKQSATTPSSKLDEVCDAALDEIERGVQYISDGHTFIRSKHRSEKRAYLKLAIIEYSAITNYRKETK